MEMVGGTHSVAKASLAQARASPAGTSEERSLRKMARALARRMEMLSAWRCSRRASPTSVPERAAMRLAKALKVHAAEGPHPPEVSATIGRKEKPW